MNRENAREAGFVLPTVLAILIVAAAAAAMATQQLQTRTTITAVRLDGLRLRGLADGIARLVSASLLIERTRGVPGLGLPEDGTPVACTLSGGVRVEIAVQDQAGLVDLNASPRSLLEDAFRAVGVQDRDAATIAAEIVDYRDPDDTPEPGGGAEAPQYKARGLAYGPRDAPFGSIDELDLLPSMTDAIAAILRPGVTVWNPGGGVDPTLVRARALTRSVASEGLRKYVRASSHQYYEVRVVVETPSGSRSGRAAILSVDGRNAGIGLLSWRYSTVTASGALGHPACARILAAMETN